MAVTFNHEPTELEMSIVNAIEDVHSNVVVFNNIVFDCERIEDAAGHVFKRDDPCETTAIDQRKMLEADALELYNNVSSYGGKSTFTEQDLIDLLDRQAVITKRECLERAAKAVEIEPVSRGTLTAKRVRDVLLLHLPHREYYSLEQTDAWQVIADELNAALGNRTCKIERKFVHNYGGEGCDTYEFVLSCGHSVEWLDPEPPRRCPTCGKAVER